MRTSYNMPIYDSDVPQFGPMFDIVGGNLALTVGPDDLSVGRDYRFLVAPLGNFAPGNPVINMSLAGPTCYLAAVPNIAQLGAVGILAGDQRHAYATVTHNGTLLIYFNSTTQQIISVHDVFPKGFVNAAWHEESQSLQHAFVTQLRNGHMVSRYAAINGNGFGLAVARRDVSQPDLWKNFVARALLDTACLAQPSFLSHFTVSLSGKLAVAWDSDNAYVLLIFHDNYVEFVQLREGTPQVTLPAFFIPSKNYDVRLPVLFMPDDSFCLISRTLTLLDPYWRCFEGSGEFFGKFLLQDAMAPSTDPPFYTGIAKEGNDVYLFYPCYGNGASLADVCRLNPSANSDDVVDSDGSLLASPFSLLHFCFCFVFGLLAFSVFGFLLFGIYF